MSAPSDKRQSVESGEREWKRAEGEGVFGLSQEELDSHNWSARQQGRGVRANLKSSHLETS